MAVNTSTELRRKMIYCVFVRNYSENGKFIDVEKDLERIRDLGTDIVWFLPIHPIGEKERKGSLGSPYAIKDYRAVNPEYGTMEDFRRLTDRIHELGMKCMIDVVYNHTSPDSVLASEHPEWFYHKPDGSFGNWIGDWTDIIDLDYSNRGLREYLKDTMKMWAGIVDGFRCDVAPMVPIDFWMEAREAVEKVHPGFIWLAESVEPTFIRSLRADGHICHSDGEMFRAFDLSYDYDIYSALVNCLSGRGTLQDYLDAVNRQEGMYPDNYVKMRFLENHDYPRAAHLISDPQIRRNWTAFMMFQKGAALIYNGQEKSALYRPTLFDKDTIDFENGEDISNLIRAMAAIKDDLIAEKGAYCVKSAGHGIIEAEFALKNVGKLVGFFHTEKDTGCIPVSLENGYYTNLITGEKVLAENGIMTNSGEPVVIRIA